MHYMCICRLIALLMWICKQCIIIMCTCRFIVLLMWKCIALCAIFAWTIICTQFATVVMCTSVTTSFSSVGRIPSSTTVTEV